jgi:hypothetical protein
MFRTFSAEHLVIHREPDKTERAIGQPLPFHRQASERSTAPNVTGHPVSV